MKRLKLIVIALVAVVVLLYLVQLSPVYFANYQFQDALDSEAKFDAYNTKTEDEIRDTIYKKAKELSIPLTPEQIHVEKAQGTVNLWMDYSVHIEMPTPLQPVDLKFHPAAKNSRV